MGQVEKRAVGARRRIIGAGALCVLLVVAGLAFASGVGATVSNPGAITVVFGCPAVSPPVGCQGTLALNGTTPITIDGINGTGTGTIDASGAMTFAKANLSFQPFPILVAGAIPATVSIEATADWTGNLDPATGAMTVHGPLLSHLGDGGALLGTDCPIGPLDLNLTTGTSGAATGTPYSAGFGKVVDNTFVIPKTPDPNPTCTGATLINNAAPLPAPPGSSTTTLTMKFTPAPAGGPTTTGGGSSSTSSSSTTTSSSTTSTTAPKVTPPTAVSVGNGSILEGDAGTHVLSIPVTRADAANGNGTVHYAVTTGTAKSTDFTPVSGNLSFTGTTRQKTIAVTVKGDKTIEKNEAFKITLSSPSSGYSLGRSVGAGTILNDDAHSKLTVGIGDAAVVVTNSGSQTIVFAVTLSKAVTSKVTMHFAVAAGTAKAGAGKDFTGTMTGTVTIAAGARQGKVTLTVLPKPGTAANKTLTVTLSSLHAPSGSSFVRTKGTGTLINP